MVTLDVFFAEFFQNEDLASGKQSGIQLERRILRRRADQNDAAFFHIGEERVLLRFVEAVHLVDEQYHVPCALYLPYHVFEPLLKITPILGPCQHRRQAALGVAAEKNAAGDSARIVQHIQHIADPLRDRVFRKASAALPMAVQVHPERTESGLA